MFIYIYVGTPLDPSQSAQLTEHMSSLRVRNENAISSRNALFALNRQPNHDFISVEGRQGGGGGGDGGGGGLSRHSSYDPEEHVMSSQGSFNDGCDFTTINQSTGADEMNSQNDINVDNQNHNNHHHQYAQSDDEYSDPSVWMNGGGVASSMDSEGYSNIIRRGGCVLDGKENDGVLDHDEDSDSIGALFPQHRSMNKMRNSDNDMGSGGGDGMNRGNDPHRDRNDSHTLTLSEPSVNPFYQVCCPSFLRQTEKPENGVISPNNPYEPLDQPPPIPKLAGSTSFAEMFAASQSSSSQAIPPPHPLQATSSFDLIASTSSGSNGWIHDSLHLNGTRQPIPVRRRGSQTGGFGNLNFDCHDDSNQNDMFDSYSQSSLSQPGSQSQEYIISTPMNDTEDSIGNPFNRNAQTPRNDQSSNNGISLDRQSYIHGPTKIFIAPGEIPSRKTVEFEELFELGRGQFGSVSCCRKRTDGVNYAIKRQVLDRMSSAARAVAKREVYALSALPDCPNLVRYYDAWYEANETLLFVQMEYLPGGTLLCLAERHVLDEESARRAIRDIARALAYMHGKGIGHLDVKPENILAVGDGGFKLGDLGHATLLDFDSMTPEVNTTF